MELFSSIWKLLKVILVVALLCLALWFSFGGAVPAFLAAFVPAGFVGMGAALACLGLALVIDPGTVAEIATQIGTGLGAVVGGVIGAVASGSGLSSVLLYAALGLGAYFLIKQSGKKDKKTGESDETTHSGMVPS